MVVTMIYPDLNAETPFPRISTSNIILLKLSHQVLFDKEETEYIFLSRLGGTEEIMSLTKKVMLMRSYGTSKG